MFKALRSIDDAAMHVASLWQCGLTATLHLRQGFSVSKLAEISCAQSELHKASDKVVSDSLPAFALKALIIAPSGQESSRTRTLQDTGIRYKGAPVSKVSAACCLVRVFV